WNQIPPDRSWRERPCGSRSSGYGGPDRSSRRGGGARDRSRASTLRPLGRNQGAHFRERVTELTEIEVMSDRDACPGRESSSGTGLAVFYLQRGHFALDDEIG